MPDSRGTAMPERTRTDPLLALVVTGLALGATLTTGANATAKVPDRRTAAGHQPHPSRPGQLH
ncbi:hypothetical protein [Streptomyces sp. NPDC003697]